MKTFCFNFEIKSKNSVSTIISSLKGLHKKVVARCLRPNMVLSPQLKSHLEDSKPAAAASSSNDSSPPSSTKNHKRKAFLLSPPSRFDDSSDGVRSDTGEVGSGSEEGYEASSSSNAERQSGSSGSDSVSSSDDAKKKVLKSTRNSTATATAANSKTGSMESKRTETSSMSSSVLADFSSDVEEFENGSCYGEVTSDGVGKSFISIENNSDMNTISRLGDSFAMKEFHPTSFQSSVDCPSFSIGINQLKTSLDERKPSPEPCSTFPDETENIHLLEDGVLNSPIGISQSDRFFSSFSSTFNCPSFSSSLNHLFDMPTRIIPTLENKDGSDSKEGPNANIVASNIQSTQKEQLVPMAMGSFGNVDSIRNDCAFGWNYIPAMPINYGIPFIPMPICSPNPPSNRKRKSSEVSYPAAALGLANAPSNVGCKCSKTRCLKLYCDCFQNNKTCAATCSCVACLNTEQESGQNGERTKAIHNILMRRPTAFQNWTKTKSTRCSCKNSR